MKSHHTIIHGDSRQMNHLADRSVHLVVTSPPYWQLKDYGTENQIGFHESYESYINNLNLVWNECERATLQSIVPDDDQSGDSVQFSIINRS